MIRLFVVSVVLVLLGVGLIIFAAATAVPGNASTFWTEFVIGVILAIAGGAEFSTLTGYIRGVRDRSPKGRQ